jgi:hypothetical protein
MSIRKDYPAIALRNAPGNHGNYENHKVENNSPNC